MLSSVLPSKQAILVNIAIMRAFVSLRALLSTHKDLAHKLGVFSALKRRRDVDGDKAPELERWLKAFEADKAAAALDYWFEIRKGISETLTSLA